MTVRRTFGVLGTTRIIRQRRPNVNRSVVTDTELKIYGFVQVRKLIDVSTWVAD